MRELLIVLTPLGFREVVVVPVPKWQKRSENIGVSQRHGATHRGSNELFFIHTNKSNKPLARDKDLYLEKVLSIE